jgi:hypothetical protein
MAMPSFVGGVFTIVIKQRTCQVVPNIEESYLPIEIITN